ncbi:MAG: hypothetical protein EOM76_11115, partial [Sphingobacteriia bacterium]|nr:hypothetical protein [Sphingobacteriia bacterium]
MKAQITHNKAQNGIELKFASAPDQSTISEIKSLGFRWSMRNKVWYKTYSEYLWKRVQEKFGDKDIPAPEVHRPEPAVKAKPQITELIKRIATQKYKDFVNDIPNKIEGYNHYITIVYNPAKKQYEHTPPKRKTPDKYPLYKVHHDCIEMALESGIVIDWDVYYSSPMVNQSGYIM